MPWRRRNWSGDESGSSPELAALDQRIAKLEAALPDLSSDVDQGTASAKSGAAAIAFANLREAVSAGALRCGTCRDPSSGSGNW